MRSAAARLGSVCHAVLEDLARSGSLIGPVEDEAIDGLWRDRLAGEIRDDDPPARPEAWPDFHLLRARLPVVVRRIAALVASAGPGATVRPEVHLTSRDGRLHGYADLIVDGTTRHLCVDYKTGRVLEPVVGTLREEIAAQLQLYAALEHDTTGRWPGAAVAVPFGAPIIEVSVDPSACTERAQDAINLLDEYNTRAPGTQPAFPSPANCRYCEYSTGCAAFWDACAGWTDVVAISGLITAVASMLRGGAVFTVGSDAGSVPDGTVRIRCSDQGRIGKADSGWLGRRLWATFLAKDRTSDVYDVKPWTGLVVEEA